MPTTLGKYPAGNILFNLVVLMARATTRKVLLVTPILGIKKFPVPCFPPPLGNILGKYPIKNSVFNKGRRPVKLAGYFTPTRRLL